MRRRNGPTRKGPLLTRGQVFLTATLVLLIVAMGAVVVLAYININAASSFQSAYVLTNLANVQRDIIELHVDTNRILRDRSSDMEPLGARRDALSKQLDLARAEASGDSLLISELNNLGMLLDHYNYEIGRLSANPTDEQFRTSAKQLDNVLEMMGNHIEALYGSKEIEFYHNIDAALELQRTSQSLTVGLGGLLLLFGVVLFTSVRRSVSGEFQHAYERLTAEVGERRRIEDELRQQNAYLAALNETTPALMNRLNTDDLLAAIVTRAAQILGTEHGYIYLVNPAKQMMERKIGIGFFAHSLGFGLERGRGLAGWIWETGEPLVVTDYRLWPRRVPTPGIREEEIRAVMGVPLRSGQQVVGAIGLAFDRDFAGDLGERGLQLLDGFGQLASIALDNARLFAEAEERTLQVEALYHADQELYRHLQLDQVLSTLVDVAVDILKFDKSALLVWDERREELYPKAARGFLPETLERMRFRRGHGLVGEVAERGEPLIVQDTTVDRRVDWNITYPERIRSFIHVPVIVDGAVFGIFNVAYTRPYAFDDEDLRLVVALAQRAASAIQNAHLYEQAQQAAMLEERQRLARELHDAVTQTLFSASIIADILPRLYQMNPEEGRRRAGELRELTRGALAEMRTLLLELRPRALSDTPIAELLHQLGEATVGRARVPVEVSARVDCELPLDVKVALYRIAQEALNNIAKHAVANHVEVTLECTRAGTRLCVRDDGIGFDAEHLRADNLGVRIMRERAGAIGAELHVDTHPGQGTAIEVVWLPVEPCDDAEEALPDVDAIAPARAA